MKLPSFKRINENDFEKDYLNLIRTLSSVLNYGIELIYQTLNKNVTARENLKMTVKDIFITVDSTGKPITSGSFKLDITNSKVDGIQVVFAQNQANSNHYPSGGVFITGSQVGDIYNISNISGIQANENYLLRVYVWQI